MRPHVATPAAQPLASRSSGAPVVLYQTSKPACAYDEVATVRVTSNTLSQTDEQLAARLRTTARELGGDAVVGVTSGRPADAERRNDDGTLSDDHSHDISGTVVRFRDARCSAAGVQ